MHVHRSARTRDFTVLGNEVLRDSRLSFCARGILAHLLSQPDGKREDIRTLAERTPEGRERVAAAMRELQRFGYLMRTKKRTADGHIYTELSIFDVPQGPSPQVTPGANLPGSGGAVPGPDDDYPVKERDEEPALPAAVEDVEEGRQGDADAETQVSTALLARIAHSEPKLSLGLPEALRLAPLVTEWRRRGASDLHVIGALTAGLPRGGVYHPARFLESRLRSKMPAERRVAPSPVECDECGVPVLAAGLCRSCLKPARSEDPAGRDVGRVASRGAALARAALRGLSIDAAVPALA